MKGANDTSGPPPGRVPAAPRAGRREQILDAAVHVFAEKGFYSSKVSDIAQRAGVADGTIYLYFSSKEDLLISLFEERMDRLNRNLRESFACEVTAEGKLRRFIELHLELLESDRPLMEVLTVELRQSAKFMREYKNPRFADLLKLLAGAVEEGQSSGELRKGISPHLAARALFGAVDELCLARALGRSEPISATEVSELLIGGIRNPQRDEEARGEQASSSARYEPWRDPRGPVSPSRRSHRTS